MREGEKGKAGEYDERGNPNPKWTGESVKTAEKLGGREQELGFWIRVVEIIVIVMSITQEIF